MNSSMISILVLFLLGVATPRHISYYDNDSVEPPIITKTQQRRICAELCMAGLGGEPCGDDCLDVIPQGLPTKSQSNESHSQVQCTRKDACPLLCANQLGYPLCNCTYALVTTPFFKVNFLGICSLYCEKYDYQIYGCDKCEVYKNMTQTGSTGVQGISELSSQQAYDWNAWCVQMCKEGDGGSACYCDLLPFALLNI